MNLLLAPCCVVVQPVYTFEEASMPEYVLQEVLKQVRTTPATSSSSLSGSSSVRVSRDNSTRTRMLRSCSSS